MLNHVKLHSSCPPHQLLTRLVPLLLRARACVQMNHMMPFKLCLKGQVPHGAAFLKFCKFGTMQYIVLKPSFTLFAVILSVSQ
jgi:hypothetical protein